MMTEPELTEVIKSRAGFQVKCAEHGLLFDGRSYPKERYARIVASQHRTLRHGTGPAARPKVYRFTRDQLIGAISRLEAYPATAGPGQRVFISAESMADGIIEALEGNDG